MLATSLPVALDNGAGLPGLIAAMFLIGLGVGAIKATISPFIGATYFQDLRCVIPSADTNIQLISYQ